jgi:two-component system, NtrC family, sensor kinase
MEKTREILSRYSAGMASVQDVHRAVCEGILAQVKSTRASIWYFSVDGRELVSACVADTRHGISFEPIVLQDSAFPDYFDAVKSSVYVRASNAHVDPATSCFSMDYFKPLGIESLLDFVIKLRDRPVAVLCCEHCGATRDWTMADQDFLHNMAVLLRISFIVQDRENRRQVA